MLQNGEPYGRTITCNSENENVFKIHLTTHLVWFTVIILIIMYGDYVLIIIIKTVIAISGRRY